MSRRINFGAPLSEDDKEYLLSRSGGEELIAMNDRQFGHLTKTEQKKVRGEAMKAEREDDLPPEPGVIIEDDDYHPDDIKKVEQLTEAQVRAALKKAGLSVEVTKEDQDDLKEDDEDVVIPKEVLAGRLLNYLDAARKAH